MYGFFTSGILEAHQLSQPIGRVIRNKNNRRRWHQRIYFRDKGICQFCLEKVTYEASTLDHIKPLVRGGKDQCKENMALACHPCNRKKGPHEMEDPMDLSAEMLQNKWVEAVRAIR